MKKLLFLLVFLCAASSCAPECDPDSCTRVLFIGNSYTYTNDLPDIFAKLAGAGEHPVETGMQAGGGQQLAEHAASESTLSAIQSSAWDYVVLQEQSQIPAARQARIQVMYPAARSLVNTIENTAAIPILFITWAHRDGWPENSFSGHTDMQSALTAGYLGIANELEIAVAPVGPAWLSALKTDPQLALWQEDGSHPAMQGTYLAACVFYAVIFRESPQDIPYYAGLPREVALELQSIAGNTVLQKPASWNLR